MYEIRHRINLGEESESLLIPKGVSGQNIILLELYENNEKYIVESGDSVTIDIRISNTETMTIFCLGKMNSDIWYMSIPSTLTREIKTIIATAIIFNNTTAKLKTGYFTISVIDVEAK